MSDKRLVIRLVDYWNRIKKDDEIPDFRKNNPTAIEDIWEQCLVLSVVPNNKLTYKYDYLGDKIKKIYGNDLTGVVINLNGKQFPDSIVAPRLKSIHSLSDIKFPQEDTGQMPTDKGKFVKYRTVILPFGNKKAGLTHVVVGVSYREF